MMVDGEGKVLNILKEILSEDTLYVNALRYLSCIIIQNLLSKLR